MTEADRIGEERPAAPDLLLFVAGREAHSVAARRNLERIVGERLAGQGCEVRVIDVFENFRSALEHGVVVTPTLLVGAGRARAVVIGDLSDEGRVLCALGVA